MKHDVKRACIFHLTLAGILSILILSFKNWGWDGGVVYRTKSVKRDGSHLSTVPNFLEVNGVDFTLNKPQRINFLASQLLAGYTTTKCNETITLHCSCQMWHSNPQ